MISIPVVAFALASLPVCAQDLDDPRKPGQLATIAESVAKVSNSDDEAAKLLTLINHESAGCIGVHSGEHRGRGRGLFQVEGKAHRYPGPLVGLSQAATDNAARVAVTILRKSYQCGPTVRAVFTSYAGRTCGSDWPTLASRARTYHWMRLRMAKFRREHEVSDNAV